MPEPIPANDPIPIVVALGSGPATAAPIKRPAVAIIPDFNTWNDFQLFQSADLLVLLPEQAPIAIDIRFMIEGVNRTETFFTEVLARRDWVYLSEVNARYCSVLGEADSYG